MDEHSFQHSVELAPLRGAYDEPCMFGVVVTPSRPHIHIDSLPVEWLRDLVRDRRLVVLRDFDSFDSSHSLVRYCSAFGEIKMWQFGAVLELVQHPNPEDHVFDNSYVPLHWDGMYLDTVPEFQVFHCVHAIDEAQGGRTIFSSTPEALLVATPQARELWSRARGSYQRSVALYSSRTQAPITDRHPRRHFPILRFCEPPPDSDDTFINPSIFEFDGIAPDEHQVLLSSLRSSLYDPRVSYAHHWQAGDVVVADNFTLLHGREAYASRSGRHLRRVHIHGDPPLRNPHISTSYQHQANQAET